MYGFDGNWYEGPQERQGYAWTLASMVEAPRTPTVTNTRTTPTVANTITTHNQWKDLEEKGDDDEREQKARDLKEMEWHGGEYENKFPKTPMGNYSKPKLCGPRFRPMPKKAEQVPLSLFCPTTTAPADAPELCPATIADSKDGWQWVKGVVDSGAANSVAHPDMCPQYPVRPSAGSMAGVEYTSASGGVIPNLGEQILEIVTNDGRETQVRYQSADVSRTLNSVSEICDGGGAGGQYVLFSKWGGQVLNPETGRRMAFDREGGIYTMGMWVRPNDKPASVFPRPAK